MFEEVFVPLADVGFDPDQAHLGRDCAAYTENEDRVHSVFAQLVSEISELAQSRGLNVKLEVDPFGNSYAVLEGESDDEIIICSHLDSVPNGGRFDGVVGVAAGLEVIKRFVEENKKPNKTIRAVGFRAEESSVTGHACLGSSLATGNFSVESLEKRNHEVRGISLKDVLAEKGVTDEGLNKLKDNPVINGDKVVAVVEVHVEQSPVLEALNKPVGIVSRGIGGARRSDLNFKSELGTEARFRKILKVSVKGEAGHSGGLPMNGEVILNQNMNLRRDAVIAVAKFLDLFPGSINLTNIFVPNGNYNTVPKECCFELAVTDDFEIYDFQAGIERFLLSGMTATVEVDESYREVQIIRDDVSRAAMRVIASVDDVATEMARASEGAVRVTFGDVYSRNGEINMKLDQRRLSNDIADYMKTRVLGIVDGVGSDYEGVKITEDKIVTSLATPLSESVSEVIRESARGLGLNLPDMGSMPGHDIAKVIRAKRNDEKLVDGGMIYIRGLNKGISHNPDEFSDMEDIKIAVDLLYESVKKMAT